MKPSKIFFENLNIALLSIKSQLLRSILTVSIIAIGITALVGILTAIDVIKEGITGNFANIGANTFTIRNRTVGIRMGKRSSSGKVHPIISYQEAHLFKENFKDKAIVSVNALVTPIGIASFKNNKTDANLSIFGVDEFYISAAGYQIDMGRNFSSQEISFGAHVAIIGSDVNARLFETYNGENQYIRIGNISYLVIGILKSKGNSFGFGGDKAIFIPLKNAKQNFSLSGKPYVINVLTEDINKMEEVISEATIIMRQARKLRITDPNNFEIAKSDSISSTLIENLSFVSMAATLIAIITLIGAAIGLMNIMLVSVNERTREIGIRKSLGAKQVTIRNQFLMESIIICQIGGFLGILIGISIGNMVSVFFNGGFIVPYVWISLALLLCFTVGISAGIYPANQAAKLDPIEALRIE
jgi:putative ABC transport system permease protein